MHSLDTAVIFSIKPQYSSQILQGVKTVELRRKVPNRLSEGGRIVIYSSSPERQIVAIATVQKIDSGKPKSIWAHVKSVAGISKESFFEYFDSRDEAFAITLSEVKPLAEPMNLEYLREKFGFTPPQSFSYAPECLFESVNKRL